MISVHQHSVEKPLRPPVTHPLELSASMKWSANSLLTANSAKRKTSQRHLVETDLRTETPPNGDPAHPRTKTSKTADSADQNYPSNPTDNT